jgi:hypothetical protein
VPYTYCYCQHWPPSEPDIKGEGRMRKKEGTVLKDKKIKEEEERNRVGDRVSIRVC